MVPPVLGSYHRGMFRVQYLCPRQSPHWQDLTEPFLMLFQVPQTFRDFPSAQTAANRLIWQFHSVRVLDAFGRVVYQA